MKSKDPYPLRHLTDEQFKILKAALNVYTYADKRIKLESLVEYETERRNQIRLTIAVSEDSSRMNNLLKKLKVKL